MNRVVDTDAGLSRFLATAVLTLRPNSLAEDFADVTGSLQRSLDRLELVSGHLGAVAAELGRELGVPADTPAAAQAHAMRHIRDTLRGLHAGLQLLSRQSSARQNLGDGPRVPSGFVYRD
jgi:hypothetical protein